MTIVDQNELVPLVSIEHHNIALLFSNYLNSINIVADVKQQQNQYTIYCSPAYTEQAKQAFEAFIKQPYHPKYQQAAWNSGDVSSVQSNQPSLGTQFKKQFLAHAGPVTLVVFISCWLVFLGSMLGWAQLIFSHLQFYTQIGLTEFLAQPFKLIGPALFHFSWLHIVFNTMWWWQLGGDIEQKLGAGALLNLFFISAIISNVGQYVVSGPNFGGLSGVVYAVVGYVWWYGWLAPNKGLMLSKPIVGFLLFWLALGYVNILPINMANTAHLLGLLSGCGLAWLKIKVLKN